MRRTVAVFICVLVTGTPFGVHAELTAPEPELPPSTFTSFTLNGAESNAVITSSAPSVAIAVQAPEEAYFTRLYICQSAVEPCDGSSYTKRFDINATTTAFTREWDGATSSGDIATSSEYQIVTRFYRYDIQPDAFEEIAPYSITISDAESVENPLPDSDSDQTTSTVPSILFTLNDVVDSAIISSTSPPVAITASSSVEVYFSSLSLCLELSVECTSDNAIQHYDINATTTAFSQVWDGTASSSEPAPAGVYRLVARFYTYDVSPEIIEAVASSTITILRDESSDNTDDETGGVLQPPAPPPAFTRITEASYLESIKNNTASTVWRKAESPYVIEENIRLRFGVLTIEPGVVIKFAPYATLSMHADVALTIQGTATEPVYFTSLKDDKVGGDTNNDADATAPAPGDWGYVSFGNDGFNRGMDMRYIKVRYGGKVLSGASVETTAPALQLSFLWFNGMLGKEYTLEHLETSQNAGAGLSLFVGKNHSVSISNSSFYDNAGHGVSKTASVSSRGFDETGALNLSGNWWGSETGPYDLNLNPEGEGDAFIGTRISLDSWLFKDPFATEPERYECCSSVVFLPGLQGSVLETSSLLGTPDTLWPPTLSEVGRDLEQLAFNEDGTPVTDTVAVNGILNYFLTQPIYQGFTDFMNTLVAVDSETSTSTIKAWKPLAYDWRYGPDNIVANPVHTTDGDVDLIASIEALAADSYTGKVTIIAHSYGGLVGKALIRALEEKGEADLIDSFIMVGSPQLGTPQAVAGLLHGEGSDLGVDIFGNRVYTFVTKKHARTLGHNLESAYTLLPSLEYFNRVNEKIIGFKSGGPYGAEWIASYSKEGIKNYNDLASFLVADFVPRAGGFGGAPAVLNATLVTKAGDIHNTYDVFSFPDSMRVVQIAGWGLPTIKGVEYSGGISRTDYKVLLTTEGDKIVVYPSAIGISGAETYYFNLDPYQKVRKDTAHKNIISVNPTTETILSVIKKETPNVNEFISKDKPPLSEENNKLIVSAHSPVTLGVTDQFGNYTGIAPGQDPDADILLITTDIPGSSYFTVGDAKYLVLPDDGQYTFTMRGTGEGEVTVIIETLSNENQTTTATYHFTVSTSSQAVLSVTNGTPTNIEIDHDRNGTADETVLSDEAQITQKNEESKENAPEPVAPTPPASLGGGPLRNTPTVLGAATTGEVAIVSPTIAVTAVEPSPTEQETPASTPALAIELLNISAQEESVQLPAEEVPSGASQHTPTSAGQQAAVIQSGWYDTFVEFIKRIFIDSVNFIQSLF